MTPFLIAGLLVVAVLVVWVALQNSQAQGRTQNVEKQMSELRRDLQTMATAQAQSAGQIAAIGQSVTQRLDSEQKRYRMAYHNQRRSPRNRNLQWLQNSRIPIKHSGKFRNNWERYNLPAVRCLRRHKRCKTYWVAQRRAARLAR